MRSPPRIAHALAFAASVALFASLIRGARANAPPCQYAVVNGTVFDANTKLTWERTLSSGLVTWSQANDYCANLSFAGGGWRMPTIQELQTLIDESRSEPAIDDIIFPDTPLSYAWSKTPVSGAVGPRWRVNFYDGFVNAGGMNSTHTVRCVR